MKPPRITDAEIVRLYQDGTSYRDIPASSARIARALLRSGVDRRPVGKPRTRPGDWIAEVAAITGGAHHPDPPPVYRGTSRLRQRLNARRLQEQEAA